jgi:hypothetical protein
MLIEHGRGNMPGDGAVMKHSLNGPPMRLSLAASSLIGALFTYRTSDSAAGALIARAVCGKRMDVCRT